jgi:hypothetical protein
VAFPPGIRVASSGAHDFVAVGGASALGSVASFGSIAPQAVNIPAKLASDTLSRALRVDLGKRGAMEDRVGIVSAPAPPCDRCGGNRAGRRPARLVYLADAGCRRKMRPTAAPRLTVRRCKIGRPNRPNRVLG